MARRSATRLARDITVEVWTHPANRSRRARALLRSARWQLSKRLAPRPRDLPFHGGLLRAYPDSNSASNVVYFTELYDFDEMRFLQRFVRPGDVAVDGGANIGTYALLLAGLVGPRGRVHAFEPVPRAHARLLENVELNRVTDVVVPHACALGAEDGEVTFLTGSDVSNRIVGAAGAAGRATLRVAVATLDGLVTEPAVRVLKLDLEGAETAALRGGPGVLARTDAVLVEVIGHLLHKLDSSPEELVGLLRAAGLGLYVFDATGGTFRPAPARPEGNIIALSERGRVEARRIWGPAALPAAPGD